MSWLLDRPRGTAGVALGCVGVNRESSMELPDLRELVSISSSFAAALVAASIAGAFSSNSMIVPCAVVFEMVVVLDAIKLWGRTSASCEPRREPTSDRDRAKRGEISGRGRSCVSLRL